jgi:hypothetical protein
VYQKGLCFAMVVCVCASGCAGDGGDNRDEYAGISAARYENPTGRWEIYDKPAEGRLKIAQNSTLANPASAAFGRAVTFGDLPREEYQRAVEAWLAGTGRTCMIAAATPIIVSQWEFRYSCP